VRYFCADSNMPIIMLTARKEEAYRVMALELGADDYLTKPYQRLAITEREPGHEPQEHKALLRDYLRLKMEQEACESR
jgi:DNA-binding response OmpR family regulator